MRLYLNLVILALASTGMGVIVARHVPATTAGVTGILGLLFAAGLICAGLIAERKA
jgi:hypothetical protein